eukprot:7839654-Alexandrium_andersonii.AAC.1
MAILAAARRLNRRISFLGDPFAAKETTYAFGRAPDEAELTSASSTARGTSCSRGRSSVAPSRRD